MSTFPLEQYDAESYGPLLGVSDEGSAAGIIADAAYESAKAVAKGTSADRAVVGMIVDGERMGSAGEVPIGPDEYQQVLDGTNDRTFCTTNVGVRVNARLLQPLPEFPVAEAADDEEAWLEKIFKKFQPFIDTPDGNPRPLTVRLLVNWDECDSACAVLPGLVKKLEEGRNAKKLGSKSLHRLSFLLASADEIGEGTGPIKAIIDLAKACDVPEVAVDGEIVEAARKRLSIQGLLNVLSQEAARELKQHATSRGIALRYRYEDDEETAARTVWTGEFSAQQKGFNGAKYGLIPLQFYQQEFVVGKLQSWMESITAIPAFYVDTPLVTEDDVIGLDRCPEAARKWMEMVVKQGAKVVLIDSPDRISPHRLVKADASDKVGVLTLKQIEELQEFANSIKLRVLWSGGIKPQQAFDLARLGVFGIFTTSSTAKLVPVSGVLVDDPQLAQAKEPTNVGVRRIHALVQAGFLCKVIAGKDDELVAMIEQQVKPLAAADATQETCQQALDPLNESLVKAWKLHWE